jgi:hypothetical protein
VESKFYLASLLECYAEFGRPFICCLHTISMVYGQQVQGGRHSCCCCCAHQQPLSGSWEACVGSLRGKLVMARGKLVVVVVVVRLRACNIELVTSKRACNIELVTS